MTAAISVGAGLAIAGGVGAAGAVIAGSESSSATKDATNASIAEQNSALGQQATLSQPYRDLGSGAISPLQSLLGIGGTGGAANTATQEATLSSLPGYQFAKSQGLQATTNAATAGGMSLSGNTLQALDQYSTGLADSTYQEEVGNLQSTVNTGQAAAAGQAANVGNAAANNSNALINQGNNTAGIDANEIAGITKATGNAVNAYTTNQTLQDIYGTGNTAGTGAAAGSYPALNPNYFTGGP